MASVELEQQDSIEGVQPPVTVQVLMTAREARELVTWLATLRDLPVVADQMAYELERALDEGGLP